MAVLPWMRSALAEERNELRISGTPVQGGLVLGRAGSGSRAWFDGNPLRVNDGLFCFGFSYDDTKAVSLMVEFDDGKRGVRTITPGKRSFPEQRVDGLPEKFVTPPQDVRDRIARDAHAVKQARAFNSDHIWFADKFAWPVAGPVTGVYGSRRILNGEPRQPHFGVDIAAAEGTPIHAPVNGIVRLAKDLYYSGNTLILDHGHGVSTTYLHMSRLDVRPDQRVRHGDQVGLVGQTGRATGPHLCWRLNWFQKRLDVALVAPPRTSEKT